MNRCPHSIWTFGAWFALCALLCPAEAWSQSAGIGTGPAGTGPESSIPKPEDPTRDVANTEGVRVPLLPDSYSVESGHHWVVGVALERGTDDVIDGEALRAQTVFGLSGEFRWRALGPHLRLMVSPDFDSYEEMRGLGGFGVRAHLPVFGTELSYGVGTHFEARLRDHYWLAFMTPIELGVAVWNRDSWRIQVFTGARRVFAGQLIDSFLIDPNGFDNEDARDRLDAIKNQAPWEGFINVVFGRRID